MRQFINLTVLILAVVLGPSQLFGQRTITGVVTDAVSGETLIGANILVQGTSEGTITDLDGAFTLNTERNKILVVSFIGYSSLEVPASQTMNIVLKPDNQVLDEVVVVGYGSSVKKDLTTAVTSVKSKDFLDAEKFPFMLCL